LELRNGWNKIVVQEASFSIEHNIKIYQTTIKEMYVMTIYCQIYTKLSKAAIVRQWNKETAVF
jgi:hypothetical protein